MNDILKMMAVLSIICGLAGTSLTALKQATEPMIEEQVLTYVQAPAIKTVLSGYDNDPIKDRKDFDMGGRTVTAFPAIKDGRLMSVAFETSGKGYGGDIGVMVGFDVNSDTLSGIGITTMKETPGVGTRVAEHGFTTQFKGHGIESVELKKQGGDIDAVAGATISSTGTTAAVQKAVSIYKSLKQRLADGWT
ncbi:RnfABCDGE type electron transport complex subunit G [Salidesulfovibrio brasiliensis]|uniref:RnfABCDGE type electron transport complex subunit G n=1 Tax=Salidesulfovibrio brasiliensis TaxID=221711 RepID=UPI0006D058C8|nr:RnfABCDGE type electron transport complex subunit G [Salidesulfovibrio brasiliensis]